MPTPTGESTLVVFARSPRPGRVKTRLVPRFTAEEACRIHAALLGDVLEAAARALEGRARIVLSWSEAEAAGAGLADLPPGVEECVQSGGDLGERMAAAIQDRLRRGSGRVVILGSDAPTLPGDHLVAAFRALESREVVLGPAHDGGYYLVGMSRLHPEIFRNVEWGSDGVLAVTRRRLRQAGVAWEELGSWEDVDTPEDLARLWKELIRLRERQPRRLPPRTWAVLSGLGAGRFGPG